MEQLRDIRRRLSARPEHALHAVRLLSVGTLAACVAAEWWAPSAAAAIVAVYVHTMLTTDGS